MQPQPPAGHRSILYRSIAEAPPSFRLHDFAAERADRSATNLAAVACNLRPQRARALSRWRPLYLSTPPRCPRAQQFAIPLALTTGGPVMPSFECKDEVAGIRTPWPQRLRLWSHRMSNVRSSPSAASARFDCRRAPGTLVNSAAMGGMNRMG
ncbi:hypothetical protein B0J12DRAFT_29355 [Macrophomina phaseolina]|uniref:Uncharacterized protein n=1 Tax=Macrophomina phaseolina TaxID=35725 RepID=A0ABQ8GVG5_9PEZI|nr:hypothetical protein B0J12DRAFT_29355 [Macrophomina phaseolina]